jgi:hypothetical protein
MKQDDEESADAPEQEDEALEGIPAERRPRLGVLQLRHPALRAYFLRSTTTYWALRGRWERHAFAVRRLFSQSLHEARRGGESLYLLAQVVRAVLRPALLAVLLTQVLGFGERLLVGTAPRFHLWARAHTPSRDLYSTFLDSSAQIAGVFIGLYFTTISLVASTSYKDVPREVRAAVVGEKVGSVYLQILATLCSVALMLQVAQAGRFGWSPGFLNFSLVACLSVASVFSFVVLGKRAFEFFDPATLSASLARDFMVAVKAATTAGLHHRDRSFQHSYQRQAVRSLATLHAVTRLCIQGDQSTVASTLVVYQQGLLLLRLYLSFKPEIPVDSYWFLRVQRHQSWLLTDSSSLEMAVKTHSVLMPKEEPDRDWVETALIGITNDALRSLVSKGELERLAEASESANEALVALVEHFELEQALQYHVQLSGHAAAVARAEAATEADERARWMSVRALVYGPTTIAATIARRAERVDDDMVRRLAERVTARGSDLVAKVAVPGEVREMLSSLAQTLRFENAAEGRRVTPSWFLEYMIASAFVRFLSRALLPVVAAVDTTYAPVASSLLSDGRAVEAATVIQVGLEAVQRLATHSERLRQCRERLLDFDSDVAEVEYPEVDVEAIMLALEKSGRALRQLLAQTAPKLVASPASSSRPDEFGHAYTILANASVDAIVAEDVDAFAEVFPPFVQLAVLAQRRIHPELEQYNAQTQMVFMSDPLLDLLDVSGYAAFRGRLGPSRFSDLVQRAWGLLLRSNGEALAKAIMASVDARSRSPLMSARGLIRTSWNRVFTDQMVAEGWMRAEYGYREEVRQEPLDAAVRAYFKQGRFAVVGHYFVAAELLAYAPFQSLAQPRVVQQAIAEIQRKAERRGWS